MSELYHAQQLPLIPLTRICTSCGIEKTLAENFSKGNSQYGYKARCKECLAKERQEAPPRQEWVEVSSYVCPGCKTEKAIEEFALSKNRKNGHHPICKECESKKAHARLDKRREYDHKRYQDPKNMEKKRQEHTQWRNKNIERRREQDRTRYTEDPEYRAMMRRSNLKWQGAHPMKMREYHMRRKSKIVKTEIDPVNYDAILAHDGWICHICGKPIDPNAKKRSSRSLTFDHVIPLIPRPGELQGTHCEENLKVAHMGCNVRKGNRPLETLTPYDRRGVD